MKTKRALLVSCAVILLCIIITVGTTWTLFTDEVTVNNHLQAGTLDITLTRTKLTETGLDEEGFLVERVVDTEPVVFSDPKNDNRNLFDLDEQSRIVPGYKATATIKISNHSDVAFCYWLRVKFKQESSYELQNQIQITVAGDQTKTARLSEGLEYGSMVAPIGVVPVGSSMEFTVDLEFLDDLKEGISGITNDFAQGEALDFDLVVYAVQETTR